MRYGFCELSYILHEQIQILIIGGKGISLV